jgi:chemotaxis protein methyltransferase CheR
MALGLNISELRALAEQLSDKLNLPFRYMTHSFFKRRLSQFIETNGIRKADHLMEELNDETFADEFCHYFSVETTELFRDASFWRQLRKIIKDQYSQSKFNIWFPNVASGEELYSLLILLDEIQCIDKAYITINHPSKVGLTKIKAGLVSSKKNDVNAYNFKRFEGTKCLDDYFNESETALNLHNSLLKNVSFKQAGFDKTPDTRSDIVIMRNSMLYYAKDFQIKVKDIIDTNLVSGGYLCLGVKEQLATPYDERFECIDIKEKIYNKYKFLRD